jgi:integrase/recombinase XerD
MCDGCVMNWPIRQVPPISASRRLRPYSVGQQRRLLSILYTACRREDVVRFGPDNIVGDRFQFTHAKNEHRKPVPIDIPLHQDLDIAIKAGPCGKKRFLETEYGNPFTANGFGGWFKERCVQAGVPGRAHGLRKAMAARLAEGGASAHQIMSVTGHRTLAEVERYTQAAAWPRLADAAMGFVPPKKTSGTTIEEDEEIQLHPGTLALPRGLEPLFSP